MRPWWRVSGSTSTALKIPMGKKTRGDMEIKKAPPAEPHNSNRLDMESALLSLAGNTHPVGTSTASLMSTQRGSRIRRCTGRNTMNSSSLLQTQNDQQRTGPSKMM